MRVALSSGGVFKYVFGAIYSCYLLASHLFFFFFPTLLFLFRGTLVLDISVTVQSLPPQLVRRSQLVKKVPTTVTAPYTTANTTDTTTTTSSPVLAPSSPGGVAAVTRSKSK